MKAIQMAIQMVEMRIQAITTIENFMEGAPIAVPKDAKRLTVGRKKKMLTSAQRIRSRGMLELKSMQAMWNNF